MTFSLLAGRNVTSVPLLAELVDNAFIMAGSCHDDSALRSRFEASHVILLRFSLSVRRKFERF